MIPSRRSLLSALAGTLPLGLGGSLSLAASPTPGPALGFRPFETAVREAFAAQGEVEGLEPSCRRVEVGHSEDVQLGLQGCHNDRPFAGFPAGHLRIIRSRTAPGPVRDGVRLYVATVDVAWTAGERSQERPCGRPFDFSSIPAAPIVS